MSTAPTVGGYELELGIITLLVAAPVLALFSVNRDLYPIAQREPLMAVASNVGHTILVAVGFLEVVGSGIPLFVRKVITQVCFAVTLGGLLIRIWKLYMDAGITNERVLGKHGWFIAHRHLRSRQFLLRFGGCIFLVHGAVLTVALATNTHILDDSATTPQDGYDSILNAILVVLYFFSFTVFSVKLAGAKDNFYLKFEYRTVGIGSGCSCLVWLIKLATNFSCALTTCNLFILWFSWLWMLAFSIVHPIVIASRDRKFGFFRCFEKAKTSKVSERNSLNTRTSTNTRASDAQTPTTHVRNLSSAAVSKLRQIPLAKFLTNAPAREAFRQFIVREFSVENLLFVEAVMELRARQSISKEDVNTLYEQFITATAPNQVNLPSIVVQRFGARMNEEVDVGIFDEAIDHIMKLMQRDAYRRFQKMPEWQQCVEAFAEKTEPNPAIASVTATSEDEVEETRSQVIELSPLPSETASVTLDSCGSGCSNEGLIPGCKESVISVLESDLADKASAEL